MLQIHILWYNCFRYIMSNPKKKKNTKHKKEFVPKRYSKTEALKLVREISLVDTNVIIQPHTISEAVNDDLTTRDILNTLRSTAARITEEPEQGTKGDWKYRIKTNSICVVVVIKEVPDKKLFTITVFKIKRNT